MYETYQELGFEISAGEVAGLAEAIARREALEIYFTELILDGVLTPGDPVPPLPPSESIPSDAAVRLALKQLFAVGGVVSLDEIYSVRLEDLQGEDEVLTGSLSRILGVEVDPIQERTTMTDLNRIVKQQAGFDDERTGQLFIGTLRAAHQVAEQLGTNLATVFENEDYFAEASRVEHGSPEAFARLHLQMTSGLSEDLLLQSYFDTMLAATPAASLAGLSSEDITGLREELRNDPEWQRMIADDQAAMERSRVSLTRFHLRRFWGRGEIAASLSAESRQRLSI